jgi:hypothetical protein
MSAPSWELSGSGSVVHVFSGEERSERWRFDGAAPAGPPDDSEPFDLAGAFDATLADLAPSAPHR